MQPVLEDFDVWSLVYGYVNSPQTVRPVCKLFNEFADEYHASNTVHSTECTVLIPSLVTHEPLDDRAGHHLSLIPEMRVPYYRFSGRIWNYKVRASNIVT
jgi:hypothetical protein